MKIGFVSDIHEDITRLREAFAILESQKCDKLVCLGDMVGYSVPYQRFLSSRNGPEVLELVKKCDVAIVGNHDLYAIRKLPQHTAGFSYPENWYALDYWERKKLAQDKIWLYENSELSALLRSEDKSFLESLPEISVGDFDGVKILFSHYAYPDIVGTLKSEVQTHAEVQEHFRYMASKGCTLGISGHDHVEGIMLFTPDNEKMYPFGSVKIDRSTPTWLHGPGVVNGSFANGVMVFDTKTFEIEAIPLSSEKHATPEWRNL